MEPLEETLGLKLQGRQKTYIVFMWPALHGDTIKQPMVKVIFVPQKGYINHVKHQGESEPHTYQEDTSYPLHRQDKSTESPMSNLARLFVNLLINKQFSVGAILEIIKSR